jgi:dephospho-CoA kinase
VYTIGLTGGIGSGKTSVAKWFRSKGVPVLDADAAVHRLFAGDQNMIRLLEREFGTAIVQEGRIDRAVLGGIVFADRGARTRLEKIVHPLVLQALRGEQAVLRDAGEKLCVWDIPLLFEMVAPVPFGEVWVVWVPEEIQMQRVRQRNRLDDSEIKARLDAQLPLAKKRELADTVIDNSGHWQDTAAQLEQQWERLRRVIYQPSSGE